MCQTKINQTLEITLKGFPPTTAVMPGRPVRKIIKPRLPRKITSSARINLNMFWNELEDFYTRYDNRRVKSNNSQLIPTNNTSDHARESAENRFNENLEHHNSNNNNNHKSADNSLSLIHI